MRQVHRMVHDMVPPSGTTEALLSLQSALSKVSGRIKSEYLPVEKQQLREAFEHGASGAVDFEEYYSWKYGND